MASARGEEQPVGVINVPVRILCAREYMRLCREGVPRDVPRGLADVIAPTKLLLGEPMHRIDLVPIGPGLLRRVLDNLQDNKKVVGLSYAPVARSPSSGIGIVDSRSRSAKPSTRSTVKKPRNSRRTTARTLRD